MSEVMPQQETLDWLYTLGNQDNRNMLAEMMVADPETADHSLLVPGVFEKAMKIILPQLNIKDQSLVDMDRWMLAGVRHDVGKMGITPKVTDSVEEMQRKYPLRSDRKDPRPVEAQALGKSHSLISHMMIAQSMQPGDSGLEASHHEIYGEVYGSRGKKVSYSRVELRPEQQNWWFPVFTSSDVGAAMRAAREYRNVDGGQLQIPDAEIRAELQRQLTDTMMGAAFAGIVHWDEGERKYRTINWLRGIVVNGVMEAMTQMPDAAFQGGAVDLRWGNEDLVLPQHRNLRYLQGLVDGVWHNPANVNRIKHTVDSLGERLLQ